MTPEVVLWPLTHMHTSADAHAYTDTYIHAYTHSHTHIYAHTHTYTCLHTHTHTFRSCVKRNTELCCNYQNSSAAPLERGSQLPPNALLRAETNLQGAVH